MIRHKIYGLLTTTAMLAAMSACRDDADIVKGNNPDNSGGITFTINSEAGNAGTRGVGDGYESNYTDCFSDGSSIDMLLFAVYSRDKDSSVDYVLDDSFYKVSQIEGIDRETEKQNVLKIDQFPVSVNLIPDQNKEYKIVFWAQNSGCTAYDTKDLSKVTISYEGAKANDPARDVFYCVVGFKGTEGGTKQITLVRPFAQINVGTSGWDYEGKAILQPNPEVMKYSSLKVTGVASEFNAFAGTVNSSNLQTVTFDYDVIPAYIDAKVKGKLDKIIPEYIEQQSLNHFKPKSNPFTPLFDEVFLKVHVNTGFTDHNKYNSYIGWYEYKNKTDKFFEENQGSTEYDSELTAALLTEEFKYLATCYVLIPGVQKNETPETTGSTCDVTFECKSTLTSGSDLPAGESDNVFSFSLNSVPVNRNWRTNIVSKAGAALFMNASQFKVDVYPEEYGDYYKRIQATDSNWDTDGHEPGGNENGNYNWPLDDIESSVSLTLNKIKLQVDPSKDEWVDYGNVDQRYVDLIKYMDRDKKLKITISPRKMLAYTEIAKYIEAGKMSYEYSLGGNQKGTEIITENDIDFTVNVNDLLDIYDKYDAVTIPLTETETLYADDYKAGDKPVTNQVADRFYLKYYPIEFRVKTILSALDDKDEAYKDFNPDDLVVTLRVYTSYKFTFSSDSQDEGGNLWKVIEEKGKLGTTIGKDDYEKASYYIGNAEPRFTASKRISVTPRPGEDGNNILYALKDADHGDHLRFRGAGNTNGHWIMLYGLKENCKITAKLGRDAGMDNHDTGKTSAHVRNLHVNWGQSPDYIEKDGWKGIAPFNDDGSINEFNINTKIVFQDNDKSKKTTYVNSESKIMTGFDTTISKTELTDGKDIKISVDNVGHCYYWILLSESGLEENN